jgi:hypothetical protein
MTILGGYTDKFAGEGVSGIDDTFDEMTQQSLESIIGVERTHLLRNLPPEQRERMLEMEAILWVRRYEEEVDRQARTAKRNPRLQPIGWHAWDLSDLPDILRWKIFVVMSAMQSEGA